jgi:hypothetical protein
VIASKISELANPKLSAHEESFFVAGFQEAIKYINQITTFKP